MGTRGRGCRAGMTSHEAEWRRLWASAVRSGFLSLGPGCVPGEGRGCLANGGGGHPQATPLGWESGPVGGGQGALEASVL